MISPWGQKELWALEWAHQGFPAARGSRVIQLSLPSLPIPPLTCLASEAPPHPRLALLPVLLSLAQDHSRLLQCQVLSSADLWGKGKRTAVTPRSPPPPPPHDIRESWPSTGWEIPFSIWRKEMGAPLLDPPVYVILGGSWPSQKPFPLWT